MIVDLAPPEKDIAPSGASTQSQTNGRTQNEVTPVQQTFAKVPALIVLGVLAYFAFKK